AARGRAARGNGRGGARLSSAVLPVGGASIVSERGSRVSRPSMRERAMHCSIWRFSGDPDALERGYRAVMEQVPASNHVLHAAARTPHGLLSFGTWPSAADC